MGEKEDEYLELGYTDEEIDKIKQEKLVDEGLNYTTKNPLARQIRKDNYLDWENIKKGKKPRYRDYYSYIEYINKKHYPLKGKKGELLTGVLDIYRIPAWIEKENKYPVRLCKECGVVLFEGKEIRVDSPEFRSVRNATIIRGRIIRPGMNDPKSGRWRGGYGYTCEDCGLVHGKIIIRNMNVYANQNESEFRKMAREFILSKKQHKSDYRKVKFGQLNLLRSSYSKLQKYYPKKKLDWYEIMSNIIDENYQDNKKIRIRDSIFNEKHSNTIKVNVWEQSYRKFERQYKGKVTMFKILSEIVEQACEKYVKKS